MKSLDIRFAATLVSMAALIFITPANADENVAGLSVPGSMPKNTTVHPQGSSLADQLRGQLEQRGWSKTPAEDGSRYYLPPTVLVAQAPAQQANEVPTVPTAAKAAPSLAEQLRTQLESRGWVAAEAADGSVFYLPPMVKEPPAPKVADTPMTRALEQLQDRGWRRVVADDGSVYYLPPPHEAPAEPAVPAKESAASDKSPPMATDIPGTGEPVESAPKPAAAGAVPQVTEAETAQPAAPKRPTVETQAVEPAATSVTQTEEPAGEAAAAAAPPPAPGAQRYRQPYPYGYGWPPYPAPGYGAQYPSQPAWPPRYGPAPGWPGYSR